MRTFVGFGSLRLVLLLAGLGLLLAACSSQRALTRDEIDARVQEYYQRGVDQYHKGEFRAALESFRMARAYDLQGGNPSIAEMIEKTEAKLRIPSNNTAAAAAAPAPKDPAPPPPPKQPTPAAPPAAANPPPPPPAPAPGGEASLKIYRSVVYPYSIEIPENWALGPEQPQIAGIPVEVLAAPERGPVPTDIGTLAVRLPPDVDARAWFESMRKGLRSGGIDPIEIGKRPVDGAEAFLMRAATSDHRGKHAVTMAMFESERIGWLIMFSTTPEQSERLQPLFHKMLDSFRIGKQNRVV